VAAPPSSRTWEAEPPQARRPRGDPSHPQKATPSTNSPIRKQPKMKIHVESTTVQAPLPENKEHTTSASNSFEGHTSTRDQRTQESSLGCAGPPASSQDGNSNHPA